MLKKYSIHTILLIILILAGCSTLPKSQKPSTWADKTLSQLSLREKIGQMMVYRMNMQFKDVSPEKWEEINSLITSDGIGTIHLWYGEAGSSIAMMNQMQTLSKVPILFDADIEYGLNQRFPSGTDLPPLMAIAATSDIKNAYQVGKIIAKEARAVGVHWNLSPVVDVNNNPLNPIINTRSFGEDPKGVSEFGIALMKGLQDHGMLATAKHFPGHGDTETDSHSSLAMIPSDSARLWSVEISPFQAMSNAGVDAIMVAHVHAPDYQPEADKPSSLSPFWIQSILREKIGFKGVVVTDAMSMGSISKNYSDAFALIETIKAGSDVIIQNNNYKGSIDTIEKAVNDGEILIHRINESVLKVLKMKEKVGLFKSTKISLDSFYNSYHKKEHKLIAKQVAQEAITCVKYDSSIFPFSTTNPDTLYVIDIYDSRNNHEMSSVTKGLKKSGLKVKPLQIDESDSKVVLNAMLNEIPKNALVLINGFVNPKAKKDRIFLPDNESEFVRSLMEKTDRIILASLGTPYLIQEFPNISVYLCAYKSNSVMQNALVNALLGQTKISGKLPVTIPGVADIGDGQVIEKTDAIISQKKYLPGTEIIQIIPEEIGLNTDNLNQLLNKAVQDSAWPAGVLLASKDGKIFFKEAFGHHTYDKKRVTRTSDIFDLASITKVLATTSAIMKLYEDGKIDMENPVVKYVPEFKGKQPAYFEQKSKITIRNLMTHTGGLAPFKKFYLMDSDSEGRLDSLFNSEPETGIGEKMVYSDIGLITLGKLVEKVTGVTLDKLVDSLVFNPLGMNSTFYNPPQEKLHRIVPTEISDQYRIGLIHGEVHDENAHSIGGVAGHAGLFSTARDLARFSQMMLNKGIYGWTRIFKTETVDLFTQRANVVEGNSRCLGWDSPDGEASGGVYLSDSSFGHNGFTGTSLWIDPENQIIVILLTNAVHPNRSWKKPKYYDWRQRIHSAVYETLGFKEQNPNLKIKQRWVKTP
jgi:beta-glucosidase-like glycosyl hydrolase/CubicO group peptidase (beta-lactamase class C family)